jgi:O-antigen/teichoic acid export membrane protein
MGTASMIVGLWLAIGGVKFGDRELLHDVARQHWRYGTWASATQILGYLPSNVYYFLMPNLTDLADSGALRALTTLFDPFVQANAALCLLLLPAFVRSHGTAHGRRMHKLALLVLAGGPLIYWIGMGLFHKQVVQWVYHGKYMQHSHLLWIIGFQPVIAGMCGVYGSMLRAKQKMNAVFWAGVVAAVSAIVLGVSLTRSFGLTGVSWSIVITYALHHLTLWLFSRQITSEKVGAPAMDTQVPAMAA